jgi:hypothetical protein
MQENKQPFLFPLRRPWTYTPQGYICAIIWNLSELAGIPLPRPEYFFGVIIGRKGKKTEGVKHE